VQDRVEGRSLELRDPLKGASRKEQSEKRKSKFKLISLWLRVMVMAVIYHVPGKVLFH